jgi:hypothetical protein
MICVTIGAVAKRIKWRRKAMAKEKENMIH